MKFSRSLALSGLTLAAGLITSAQADLFTFTYTDTNGVVASGNLVANDNGDGITMTCVAGDITFTAGPVGGTYLLLPGSGYSPSGGFIYNSLLYTGPVSLDGYGLLFWDPGTGYEMNIWGNGGATNYTLYTGGATYVGDGVGTFTIVPSVPTPGAAAVLGVGMLASTRRRRV